MLNESLLNQNLKDLFIQTEDENKFEIVYKLMRSLNNKNHIGRII